MHLRIMGTEIKNTYLATFNCKNITRSADCVRRLCGVADVIALQETWLLPHDLAYLGTLHDDFAYTGKSAVDTSAGVLIGRPYGGVALLWRKSAFSKVSILSCSSDRLVAIKIDHTDRSMLIFSVYMPTDSSDNIIEFTTCLSEIIAITENSDTETVCILGDFNAHPGERFASELLTVCTEQSWSCVDMELLPNDTYTFKSTANGALRWLDHCVVSSAARQLVMKAAVFYDVYSSDHIPLVIECNINLIIPKLVSKTHSCNKVIWGERNAKQIDEYSNFCHSKLRLIDFPTEFRYCSHGMCSDTNHHRLLDEMYDTVISILKEGADISYEYIGSVNLSCNRKYVTGWNVHVRDAHREARMHYQTWLLHNKPTSGCIYTNMCKSRKVFKDKLKYCQDNEQQIKMDIIAKNQTDKQFGAFWKATNKLNPRSSFPVSVTGVHEPTEIANLFKQHFKVESPLIRTTRVVDAEDVSGDINVRFTPKEVASVVKSMKRGKSPGHDGLSIEHLKYAGVHLPRVLAMFFNLCMSHCYLPNSFMFTVVVPIIKNKTGNASDASNYRPISLATVSAKVLDSLLDKQLAKHLILHDAQFGFRPGLSTESAILCLKQTVQYYKDRKTPVFACFLDLSKAFDLVSYDVLWNKLLSETSVPIEVISIFKYWYSNQCNCVRWNGSSSSVYRLECGVRQGGLSSPRLFNLYINRLIVELSSTKVGCHIDGVCTNNLSYADDMVLLSPSISAMRRLVSICESYAVTHGLKYNVGKSELMLFKASGFSYPAFPNVLLCGTPLCRVTKFKYLGHWVTDDLSDNADIERERRSLAVRCNMLARRFARCTNSVKITLFKAYCQSFYTCSLWVSYSQRAYSDLRVQYNNALRVMLGLPWRCSASGMFAEARVDGFAAIVRKRCASLLARVRGGTNTILGVFTDRWESPMLQSYYVVQMPDVVPTKNFKVYWNVPTMQCKSKKILFDDLHEKYGILQNTGDTFRGDKISILYDPGDFPALLRNSSGEIKYRNGGVPQEGDLIKHLETFQNVLEQSVPDESFNGVGIIDFESWKPVLRQNFGILTPYKDVSYEIEKKRHWWWKKQWIEEEAKRRFEEAGREFMQATVSLAKKMRPQALWGYYGYPYCFNMANNNRKEACADKVPEENDRIKWLWEESTALYPSVYSTDDMTSGQLAGLIRGRVREAARVAVRGSPILPYFWYRYRDKGYFSEKDLDIAINTFYKSNASGFIIWGSSNDVNTVEKCTNLKKYITDILGPTVAKYTKPHNRLEDEPDETVSETFKPNNASKYDPEYTWIPPVNYTQKIEAMVDKELKEEKEAAVVHKEIKESILVDMILDKIANYCAEDCDSKNKIKKTEVRDDRKNESHILLVTEDPFKKSSSKIAVTVPTTTEEDLYDYDLSTGGVTVRDFFESNEYSDFSTTIKTIEDTSTISTNPKESSTVGIKNEESSTNILRTTEDSEIDLSDDQSNAIDLRSEETSTTDISTTIYLSTTESTTNEFSTTESTSRSTVDTSTIYNYVNRFEGSTSSVSEMEPEVSLSTEDYSTVYPSTTETSTTVSENSTNSDSSTTLAPVLTEQVVVSVV